MSEKGLLFTSTFEERMKVLEYCKTLEVELCTFPDSTNTQTSRKLVFSLTSVCVLCLPVSLSVRKKLSVDILQTSRPIWVKTSVYAAIGL